MVDILLFIITNNITKQRLFYCVLGCYQINQLISYTILVLVLVLVLVFNIIQNILSQKADIKVQLKSILRIPLLVIPNSVQNWQAVLSGTGKLKTLVEG